MYNIFIMLKTPPEAESDQSGTVHQIDPETIEDLLSSASEEERKKVSGLLTEYNVALALESGEPISKVEERLEREDMRTESKNVDESKNRNRGLFHRIINFGRN